MAERVSRRDFLGAVGGGVGLAMVDVVTGGGITKAVVERVARGTSLSRSDTEQGEMTVILVLPNGDVRPVVKPVGGGESLPDAEQGEMEEMGDLIFVENVGGRSPEEVEGELRFGSELRFREEEENLRFYAHNEETDTGVIVSLSGEELGFKLEAGGYPVKPRGEFRMVYWDGGAFVFPEIPDDVWVDAVDACAAINGGVYDSGVYDARLLVALAHSENSKFVGGSLCSYAGACGRYQFMWETWKVWRGLDYGAEDARTNDRASAFIAAKMLRGMGLFGETTEAGFVPEFMGYGESGIIWNRHREQASYVWRLWQDLRA